MRKVNMWRVKVFICFTFLVRKNKAYTYQNSDQKKQLKSSFIIPNKDIFYARKSQAVLNNPSCPSKAHKVAFSKAFADFVGKAFLLFII